MEKNKEQELQQSLEKEAASFAGKAAWLYIDLSGENTEMDGCEKSEKWQTSVIKSAEKDQVISASTIKVPVMLCLFDYLRKNHIPVDTKVEVRKEQICPDSLVFEYGPREASLYELTVWMIINSDNTATNVLLDYLGFDRLNAYFANIGLTETKAQRHMLDYEAVAAGKNNYISAVDFWRCMALIWEKRKTDPDVAMAWEILTWNRDDESLLRYLYENPLCAHKSGELDQVEHDAGIFCCEKGAYFLGIFVSEMSGEEAQLKEACKLIGRMSRTVYEYYNGSR